jgi:hypothetical protein
LITGEPGSGKSVLGATLSRALRVPFIARDDVRGGLFFTAGAWSPQPRRVPTPDADCRVLHTSCRDAPERLARRIASDRLLNRRPVLEALGYMTNDEHTNDATARMRSVTDQMQTDFDLPVLEVNTDDGYEPGLDVIIDFLIDAQPSIA